MVRAVRTMRPCAQGGSTGRCPWAGGLGELCPAQGSRHSCDSRSQRTIPGSNDQMPAAIKPVGRAFPGYGGANPGAMRPLPARWCNCRFRHGRAFPGCASSVVLPRSCVSRLRVFPWFYRGRAFPGCAFPSCATLECLTLGGSLYADMFRT